MDEARLRRRRVGGGRVIGVISFGFLGVPGHGIVAAAQRQRACAGHVHVKLDDTKSQIQTPLIDPSFEYVHLSHGFNDGACRIGPE